MPETSGEDTVASLRRILSNSASRETKAKQIADKIRQHGNYRWVGIYDVSPTAIAIIAWSGPGAPDYPQFPVDRGLSGAAVRSGRTVIANDVSKDPRYLSTLDTTGAEMIVPVSNRAHVVGTVDIESEIVGRFTDSDRAFVEMCAKTVSDLWE